MHIQSNIKKQKEKDKTMHDRWSQIKNVISESSQIEPMYQWSSHTGQQQGPLVSLKGLGPINLNSHLLHYCPNGARPSTARQALSIADHHFLLLLRYASLEVSKNPMFLM